MKGAVTRDRAAMRSACVIRDAASASLTPWAAQAIRIGIAHPPLPGDVQVILDAAAA